LSKLGHTLERFLTESPENFSKMLLKNKNESNSGFEEDLMTQDGGGVFHYTQCGEMLLRSQIDCMDPRLPRRTFDLKTRATMPIRLDLLNYTKYLHYRLSKQHGLSESFERELYDMARSAFLKYNLQARIGNMDGIFVAFHNTAELFGFQYMPREYIDEILFGSAAAGDLAFKYLLASYNHLLAVAMAEVPKEHVARLTFSLSKDYNKLNLFVEHFQEYPSDRRQILPPAPDYRQYTLSMLSRVNGVRVEAFPGVPDQDLCSTSASLSTQLNISQVAHPQRADFEQVRLKCGEGRLSTEDMGSVSVGLMKQILT
jgi:hypothetical protein